MASSLASRLFSRLQTALRSARLHALPDADKRSVLQLCHAVALADGVLTTDEEQTLVALSKELGVAVPAGAQETIAEAVAHLAERPSVLELACLVVADAVFVDGDFDDAEQKFVDGFQQRFGLPSNPLRDAVVALRNKKLDAALSDWNKQIRGA